jgi:hypothetical protein
LLYSGLTLLDSEMTSGSSARGAAFFLDQSTLSAYTSRLTFGRVTEAGGAVYVGSRSNAFISNCSVLLNTADTGGGGALYVSSQSSVQVQGGAVSSNRAERYHGGAVFLAEQSEVILSDWSNVSNNSAPNGGGGAFFVMPTANLSCASAFIAPDNSALYGPVRAGPPNQLAWSNASALFSPQPSGSPISPPLLIHVIDAYAQRVLTDGESVVTLGPPSVMSGASLVRAAQGVVEFDAAVFTCTPSLTATLTASSKNAPST